MNEAICQNCGAIFLIDERIPLVMECTCNCKEFEVKEAS